MKDTSATDLIELLNAAAPLIELALQEDIGPGDATSLSTLPEDLELTGRIVAKAPGIIAGLPIVEAVLQRVDPRLRLTAYVKDGQDVTAGELIAEVTGPGRSLLAAERTLLNFLQRLSGVATLTAQYVDAVAWTETRILDTRKTLPGYRVLDKYAVRMGGGFNHRRGLYDMLLIKDNHIDAAGSITLAVERARQAYPTLPIEVEVRTLDELREALAIVPPLDRILLDNMDLGTLRAAVALTAGRVPLEASGNMTLERVAEVAATGVNFISVGALTHSAPALDISMKIASPQASPEEQLRRRAAELKRRLGQRIVILGHHYQRDEVIALADFRGDSLQLAQDAIRTDAEVIVFCGVHFMAETAAILAKPGQRVLLPELSAGCYLAETASRPAVERAWQRLNEALDGRAEEEITPITYINSDAALKAFCGRHGGLVCTSSNAARVLAAALQQRPRVFFFPDQHLGRNTALKMGLKPEEILLWTPGRSPEALRAARVILWPGACNVHQRFTPEDIARVRAEYPGVRVIVHPECKQEVVALADDAGSTSYIIKQVRSAPPGTVWAIGTESRLVRRLQAEHPEQTILPLSPLAPLCPTMGRITLPALVRVLEGLERGEFINEITVPAEIAQEAKLALERMLALA